MGLILPQAEPTVSRRRWWLHLILITAYILVVGLLGLGRKKSHTPALTHTASGLLFVCSLELLMFGLVFGLACSYSQATRDDLLLRWGGKFKPVLLGIGYSVALRVAVGLLIFGFVTLLVSTKVTTADSVQNFFSANQPGVETLVDVSVLRNNSGYYWLTLTVVSFIVAGLREELWRSAFLAGLRGLWPQRFGSRAGQIGAVFIASIFLSPSGSKPARGERFKTGHSEVSDLYHFWFFSQRIFVSS